MDIIAEWELRFIPDRASCGAKTLFRLFPRFVSVGPCCTKVEHRSELSLMRNCGKMLDRLAYYVMWNINTLTSILIFALRHVIMALSVTIAQHTLTIVTLWSARLVTTWSFHAHFQINMLEIIYARHDRESYYGGHGQQTICWNVFICLPAVKSIV